MPALGPEPVDAVFIRAPWIEEAGPGVEVLAAPRRPRGRGAPGRPDGDRVPPRAVGGPPLPRVARGGRASGPPRGVGRRGGTVSGHSKWATIKRKKGAADAKRGQLFSKLSRAIIVAAKEGGADPESNATLANAIQKARDNSMPKDNIERAIQRGAGGAEGDAYESMVYEGYAPGGVAVICDDPHRQPQPHRERPAAHLHEERRLAGHARQRRVAVRPQGPGAGRARGRGRGRADGARPGGRSGGHLRGRRPVADHHRPRRLHGRPGVARERRGRLRLRGAHDGPQDHRSRSPRRRPARCFA